jgi:hypothetical protein
MKNAVVVAMFLPNSYRAEVYVNAIRKHFSDCDVYIGLNSSFIGVEQYLNQNGFFNIVYVDKKLEVTSDASAYQAALKLLKSKNQEYKNIYFIHTKGISYPEPERWLTSCRDYFLGFCKQRDRIDALLEETEVGGAAPIGRAEPMNNGGYSKDMDKYCPNMKQTDVEDIMSLITFYGIKGNIVKHFLDNCIPEFFTTKLDRYFFETSFYLIVDKMGYKRKHLGIWQ